MIIVVLYSFGYCSNILRSIVMIIVLIMAVVIELIMAVIKLDVVVVVIVTVEVIVVTVSNLIRQFTEDPVIFTHYISLRFS